MNNYNADLSRSVTSNRILLLRDRHNWSKSPESRWVTLDVTYGYLPSQIRLSLVCNVRAPLSGRNFRQDLDYAILYLRYLQISTQTFFEIVLRGKPPCRGPWGSTRKWWAYIGPVENHISETVQATASETGNNIRGIQPTAPLQFGP